MKLILSAFTFFACSICALSQPAVKADHYLTSLFETSPLFDTTSLKGELNSTVIFDPDNLWKSWLTVENFTYGKDRGSLPMIADLNSLHPYFRDRIVELIHICKAQGIELAIVESYRTRAKQAEYFGMGRKYTRTKGGNSKHQYGLAVDVVPIINSAAIWDNISLWKKIGVAGEKLGLRWGGRWRAPFDPAHFEWSGGVTTYQLANGLQPPIPKTKASDYPCIDDEIKLLQKYWEALEVEQSVSARSFQPQVAVGGSDGQKP
jgi:hypothetical protein